MLHFHGVLGKGRISHSLSSILLVHLYLCICHCWTGSETVEVLRPRGVPLSKKVFYVPNKDFNCIDGSGTIPFHFVNDDFCDCDDGSDEPGTAACPNGLFHCVNAGFISTNIPSSRVNDEICDCCDGSDEYNSSADCMNICLELGKQAREEAQKQQELFERGASLWREYASQGKKIKENNKVKLDELLKIETEAQKMKNEKEAIRNEAEDKEKAALAKYEILKEDKIKEVEEFEMLKHQEEEKLLAAQAFKELDASQDGILTFNEIQQFPKFDSNHDGVVSEEEAKFFLHMKDSMEFEEFVSTGWMIMKPVYLMDKLPESTSMSSDMLLDARETVEYESEMEESENDAAYNQEDEDLSDEDASDEDIDDLESQPQFPPKEGFEPENQADQNNEPEYDEVTQKLVDDANEARIEFKNAFDNLEKIKEEIKQTQLDLEADYGIKEEFIALKGQCFDFDDREYTYRLCPFDKASQIPKSGGSEISLGRWGYWAGPEDNKYTKMKYENGQVCWNGPTRSAMVLMQCGLENKVLSTSEPNRCEYLFEFSTPTLCSLAEDINTVHEHTEL